MSCHATPWARCKRTHFVKPTRIRLRSASLRKKHGDSLISRCTMHRLFCVRLVTRDASSEHRDLKIDLLMIMVCIKIMALLTNWTGRNHDGRSIAKNLVLVAQMDEPGLHALPAGHLHYRIATGVSRRNRTLARRRQTLRSGCRRNASRTGRSAHGLGARTVSG